MNFIGRRVSHNFIGRRVSHNFIGRRVSHNFIGRRVSHNFIGRRVSRNFIGLRVSRNFIGRRVSHNFIGRRVSRNFPIHLFLRIGIMRPFRNCPPEGGSRAGILNLPLLITIFHFFLQNSPKIHPLSKNRPY